MNTLHIHAPADSGNIDVINADDPGNVRLSIRSDGKADFHQWFYFRATGVAGRDVAYVIENAGTSSYVRGWTNYRVCASYDLEEWFRVDTDYRDGGLFFQHHAERDSVYYAYFASYPIERYRRFTAGLIADGAAYEPLGPTLDGEPLDLFTFGEPGEGKRVLWVIGRQHPGETMGSWWMEGFLSRLMDESDAVTMALEEKAVVHVVPLVNIDGSRRGHLRTNAAGADLNREWAEPSAERSPEVLAIRSRMDRTGCDLFLDVHGDEAIANNFIAGGEGVPRWSETHQRRLDGFKETLSRLSPAFQTEQGYPVDKPGSANLRIAANQIAERFDCLSMTLEMPFKDASVLPDPIVGWSPDRCADLGRACLDAMWAALPGLR